MKKILWSAIVVAFILIISCVLVGKKNNEKKIKMSDSVTNVSGLVTKNILVAFDDYVKGQNLEGFRKEIEYYNFEIRLEEEKQIIIDISVERRIVFEKLNIRDFKGGEARYIMDLYTQKIIDKTWYK